MNDPAFWSLIAKLDWAHEGDDESVVEPVVGALAEMPVEEIAAFQNNLAAKLHAIDGRDWARESGALIWWGEPNRLSVDGFLYSRCAVVANGRDFYEAVLRDPKRTPKDIEFESLLLIAQWAYERKTGKEDDVLDSTDVSFETFSNESGWR